MCPYVRIAERVFQKYNIAYVEVDIDQDNGAKQRVQNWTGFLSVPTIVIASQDSVLPIEEPEALPNDVSPRGMDRGSLITEPSGKQLEVWLEKHGLLNIPSMATSSS
jgi:glutaredoxin